MGDTSVRVHGAAYKRASGHLCSDYRVGGCEWPEADGSRRSHILWIRSQSGSMQQPWHC